MILWITAAICALLIILDLARKIKLIGPIWMALYLPVALNAPLAVWWVIDRLGPDVLAPLIVCCFEFLYIWVHLHIFPVLDGVKAGFRLKALIGSRPLLHAHIYGSIISCVCLPLSWIFRESLGAPTWLVVANIIYAISCGFGLFLNGILRVFFTSKRLRFVRRVVIFFTLWIPVVNWIVWLFTAKLVKQEYTYGVELREWKTALPDPVTEICKTRYPILMLHGVAFRDMRFFNYWGRIPRYLKWLGADVYYGNQEAFATIEANGADVARRIDEILQATGAEKVNIIAHSKGGLDARYAISILGAAGKVASLTTMNSPHHGCRFADHALNRLSDSIVRFIAKYGDATFRRYGDKHPDIYTTVHQFRTDSAAAFNENCPNVSTVYYRSYTSVMSKANSDRLLSIPYRYIKKFGEPDNDGLVSVASAQWGDFRGTFRSGTKRGISHGDIIDLKREDYVGFNVLEAYIRIVSELRELGY